MDNTEKFINIMNGVLKEGVSPITLKKAIGELQHMLATEELKVQANTKLSGMDIEFSSMKESIQNYNEKKLDLNKDSNSSLAVSMLRGLL